MKITVHNTNRSIHYTVFKIHLLTRLKDFMPFHVNYIYTLNKKGKKEHYAGSIKDMRISWHLTTFGPLAPLSVTELNM